jgi:hypothetical protein
MHQQQQRPSGAHHDQQAPCWSLVARAASF